MHIFINVYGRVKKKRNCEPKRNVMLQIDFTNIMINELTTIIYTALI